MDSERKLKEEHQYAINLLRKNFARLTSFKNVIGAGVGLRMRNGQYTNQLCIYIEVDKKIPANQLERGQMIPSTVENMVVDVVEKTEKESRELIVKVEDLVDQDKVRPLEGGTQVTNGIVVDGKISVGTLGAMVYIPLKKDAFTGILSNHHVLYARGAGNGQAIGQPFGNDIIANNYDGKTMGTEVDMAVAKISNGIAFTNKVRSIGELVGTEGAYVKQRVRKYGRTTELTIGQVTKVGIWCNEYGCVYTGLEIVAGYPTVTPKIKFSDHGDSGSVIVSDSNKVLGLLWGGSTNNGNDTTYANDIRRLIQVAGEFKIPTPTASQMVQILSDTKRLERYKKELEQTQAGRELLNDFTNNLGEAIWLVNEQRECKVVWQRVKGPAFISLKKGGDENEPYLLQKEIFDVKLGEMIVRMCELFVKHGSVRLAIAVRKYAARLASYARSCDTLEEVIKMINEEELVQVEINKKAKNDSIV